VVYILINKYKTLGIGLPIAISTILAFEIGQRHATKALAMAEDASVFYTKRIGAAQTLSTAESSRLQVFLLDRVSADPNCAEALDDIMVLGAIGDEESAKDLEEMESTDDLIGQTGASLRRAVKLIRSGPPSARSLDE
jgi:hypothetical protein